MRTIGPATWNSAGAAVPASAGAAAMAGPTDVMAAKLAIPGRVGTPPSSKFWASPGARPFKPSSPLSKLSLSPLMESRPFSKMLNRNPGLVVSGVTACEAVRGA